ncbi:unnamed protein product, partial [Chrysoparadoxa australica]
MGELRAALKALSQRYQPYPEKADGKGDSSAPRAKRRPRRKRDWEPALSKLTDLCNKD